MSRTLNNPELNYTITKKEMLAIFWVVKRLRQYLLGQKFQIFTDHEALTWLFNVKDPSLRLMCWRLKTEEYKYKVVYKKKSENTAADALSRMHPVRENLPQERVAESEFDLETQLPDIEIMAAPQERDLNTPEPPDKGAPKTPVAYPEHPIYIPTETVIEISTQETPSVSEILVPLDNQLYQVYYQWFKERTPTRETEKPNANGKLWREFSKRPTDNPNIKVLRPYTERD